MRPAMSSRRSGKRPCSVGGVHPDTNPASWGFLQETSIVCRISVTPNSFALILTKGQEETNRLYWENSRKHESTRRERKPPPGPGRKPIAAGHAFVDVLLCRNFGLRYLRACTPYTWPSRRRRSVGTVEFTGSLFGGDLYGSHLEI